MADVRSVRVAVHARGGAHALELARLHAGDSLAFAFAKAIRGRSQAIGLPARMTGGPEQATRVCASAISAKIHANCSAAHTVAAT